MYLYLLCIFFLSTDISLCLLLSPLLFFVFSYLFILSHFLFFLSPYLFSCMPFFFFMSGFILYPPFLFVSHPISFMFLPFGMYNLYLTEIPIPCSLYLQCVHFYSNTVYQINSKLASDPVWELAKPRKPQTMDPPTEYIDCLKAAAIPGSNFCTWKCAYSQDNSAKQNLEKLSLWGVLRDRFPPAQSNHFSYCILNMHPGGSMV